MDFRPNYPYELNPRPEGEFFLPNPDPANRSELLDYSYRYWRVLERYHLKVFSREFEDPGTELPLSIRFPLPVYENKERPWEIEATNKILHDHYTATYWKLELQKLQMERGERDEPMDPSSLSSGSKKKESVDDSKKDDDPLWKKFEAWRRLNAIVRTDTSSSDHSLPHHKSKVKKRRKKKRCRRVTKTATVQCRKRNYRTFGVCEVRPVVTTSMRRRRRRRAVRAGIRIWRKAVRNKRESEIELEAQSSESDPDLDSPGTRKSVDCKGKLLVSENVMRVVAMNIPYGNLNFHPSTTKFSSMEMSMEGIMTALYEIRRQLTFYRKVARNMCLEIIRPESQPPVPDYLKQNLLIFLKDFFSFQRLLRTVIFLYITPSDTNKLYSLFNYQHGIEKQILRISQIRNAIICHVDPKTKRMKDKLEDYYKAISDFKVV